MARVLLPFVISFRTSRVHFAFSALSAFAEMEVSTIIANTSTNPSPSHSVNGEPRNALPMMAAETGSLKP